MLFLLHAYGGRTNLSALAESGADAATSLGAKQRAKVLRRVGAAGVIGLRTEGVHEALLSAANSVAGGFLTESDLEDVMPADADGRVLFRADGDAVVSGCPFSPARIPARTRRRGRSIQSSRRTTGAGSRRSRMRTRRRRSRCPRWSCRRRGWQSQSVGA